jgi:hypothetical protein
LKPEVHISDRQTVGITIAKQNSFNEEEFSAEKSDKSFSGKQAKSKPSLGFC